MKHDGIVTILIGLLTCSFSLMGCASEAGPEVTAATSSAYSGPGGCGLMYAGTELTRGHSISSCNGRYGLVMQWDSNLVLYDNWTGTPLWATGTNGWSNAQRAVLKNNGNFTVGTGDTSNWATCTGGNDVAYGAVQDDGNFVLYSRNWLPIWASRTDGPRQNLGMNQYCGGRLNQGAGLDYTRCQYFTSDQCVTFLSAYSDDGAPYAIFVTVDDGPSALFACSSLVTNYTGNRIDWIVRGHTYRFSAYRTSSCATGWPEGLNGPYATMVMTSDSEP